MRGRAQLYIDNQLVVDASEPSESVQGTIKLNAGQYPLHLHYLDYVGYSRLHLFWTPPNEERAVVPSHVLIPYPVEAPP